MRGLQSRKRAPKINAFMKFVGETGTVFRPSGDRWALVFMGGFCGPSPSFKHPEKQILRFWESGGLHRSPQTGPRAKIALGMTNLYIFRRPVAMRMAARRSARFMPRPDETETQ
jgi:hypothetical protein